MAKVLFKYSYNNLFTYIGINTNLLTVLMDHF